MPKEALTPTLSHKERAKRLGRSLALQSVWALCDLPGGTDKNQ